MALPESKAIAAAPGDLDFIADLVKKRSGLVLTKDKTYLVESRLLPLARKSGMNSVSELVAALKTRRDEGMMHAVTDALTTNETFFFRDTKPFDLFRDKVLPEMAQKRADTKSLRIWCAAASTGQEPYTLAMILKEKAAQMPGWRFEIVGTDISTEALKRAKEGLYSQFEVQRGLPIQLLVKYFKKKEEMWEISPEIRSMVNFQSLNLLSSFASLGRFDVVFCRNVLIYFDIPTKTDILARTSRQMADDGLLFLGGAETVLGITESFKVLPGQRGVYGVALPRK